MTKETIVRLVDDLDRSEAHRTVRFSWDGTAYEIDLSDANAAAFAAAVNPYVKAARRAGKTARVATPRSASAKLDLGAVRAWASQNGHRVADRGRIAKPIIEAFHAAQNAVGDVTGTSAPALRATPTKRAARKSPARKATASTRTRSAAKKAPARKATARRGRASARA
jgi:hypothetical protein